MLKCFSHLNGEPARAHYRSARRGGPTDATRAEPGHRHPRLCLRHRHEAVGVDDFLAYWFHAHHVEILRQIDQVALTVDRRQQPRRVFDFLRDRIEHIVGADRDRNEAVLGSLTEIGNTAGAGSLNSPNGALLNSGKNLAGYGTVNGDFTNDGAVHGEGPLPTDALEFTGIVDGIGNFTGNVAFSAPFTPGHSPAQVSLENVTFAATATLGIDLEGTTPGSDYDQLQVAGSINLGGAALRFRAAVGLSSEVQLL